MMASCDGESYNDSKGDELQHNVKKVKTYANNTSGNFGMSYDGKEVLKREYSSITISHDIPSLLSYFPIVTAVKYKNGEWYTDIAVKDKIFKKNLKGYISAKYKSGIGAGTDNFFILKNFIMVSGEAHRGEDYKIDVYVLILIDENIFIYLENDGRGNNKISEVYKYTNSSYEMKKIEDKKIIDELSDRIEKAYKPNIKKR